MIKHAYLIAAHNDFYILEKLVSLLDYEENDIFIHVDKKVVDFNPDPFYRLVKKAKIKFVPRIKITHGSYSLIAFELILLKEAIKTPHQYYHLLSGVDLPIKSHEQIMAFFEEKDGNEFIGFDPTANEKGNYYQKLRYFHFFREFTPPALMKYEKFRNMRYKMIALSLKYQEILGVNRIDDTKSNFWKGDQWFSVTHKFASYVLSVESQIRKTYRYTLSANENFMQTIAMNSEFKERTVKNSLRFIDWDRGSPYTFTSDDFVSLMNSDKLWARKFSSQKDINVIDRIYETLKI